MGFIRLLEELFTEILVTPVVNVVKSSYAPDINF